MDRPALLPRLGGFRIFALISASLSRGGGREYLQRAMGHYARTATGGHAVAVRRFGSIALAGGNLFEVLIGFSEARRGDAVEGFDIAELDGSATDVVVDTIVAALVVANGDADRIRVAMVEALSESLEGIDVFDFSRINDEIIVNTLLAYVRTYVFQQIVLDSKDAFAKAAAGRVQEAEDDLLELVGAATDRHMRSLLDGDVRRLNGSQIAQAQLRVIREVWMEWEGYEQ